jgi:hypothetical protein
MIGRNIMNLKKTMSCKEALLVLIKSLDPKGIYMQRTELGVKTRSENRKSSKLSIHRH